MIVAVISLLFFTAAPTLTQHCPSDWFEFEQSCYYFERHNTHSHTTAKLFCHSEFNADLLSINTREENSFLKKTLQDHFSQFKTWHTSGERRGRSWYWSSDSRPVSHTDWLTAPAKADSTIVLATTRGRSGWSTRRGTTKLPFICEIRKWDSWKLRLRRTNAEYAIPLDIYPKLHAARILEGPADTTVEDLEGTSRVMFSCEAEGRPQPKITWFTGSGQQVDLHSDKYALHNGNLIVRNLERSDRGTYYCVAENQFGKCRSRAAFLRITHTSLFPSTRLDSYAVRGEGTSISCDGPAKHSNNVVFGWQSKQGHQDKQYIKESPRVRISLDGSLHISSVRTTDAKSYECFMFNKKLQEALHGPTFRLNVQNGTVAPFKPVLVDRYPRVHPIQPTTGTNITLECLAYGLPAPSFTWQSVTPVGGAVDLNQTGTRYVIANATIKDAGVYRCISTNSEGSTYRDISLSLWDPPTIHLPLEDQAVPPGVSVTFQCSASGTPAVLYEWFRNASPLDPLLMGPEDEDRIRVNENILHIESVQSSDSGVYQCVAQNRAGWVSSSAVLRVETLPAMLSQSETATRLTTTTGVTMEIPCEVEALPSSLVHWEFNGNPVKLGARSAYSVLESGALQITNAQRRHEGKYRCRAKNDAVPREAVDAKRLTVHERLRPRITSSPAEPCYGQPLNISCVMQHPFGMEYTSQWFFNDKLISTASSNRHDLFISQTTEKSNGAYKCVMKSRAGSASQYFNITVGSPPPPPQFLRVLSPQVTSVVLTWVMPVAFKMPSHLTFQVEYCELHDTDDCDEFNALDKITSTKPRVSAHKTTVPLRPNSRYLFRVRARNSVAWSAPSRTSEAVKTLPDKPSMAPINLEAEGPQGIQWDPLPKEHWNSDEIWYVVSWTSVEKTSEGGQEKTNKTKFYIPKIDRAGCRPYEIRVAAENIEGRGPDSPDVMVFMNPKSPYIEPFYASTRALSSDSISVRWELPTYTSHLRCTDPDYLRITVQSKTKPIVLISTSLAARDEVIGHLEPDTLYLVSLCFANRAGCGPAVESTVVTKKLPPAGIPVLWMQQVTPELATLAFRKVPQFHDEEPIDGYRVHLFHGETSHDSQVFNLTYKTHEFTLRRLHHSVLYRVAANAYNSAGEGPLSSEIRFSLPSSACTPDLFWPAIFFTTILVLDLS